MQTHKTPFFLLAAIILFGLAAMFDFFEGRSTASPRPWSWSGFIFELGMLSFAISFYLF